MGPLKRAVQRWLRLPADPEPPAGSEASVRIFHAAPSYFHYALIRWGFRQVGVVAGVLFVLFFWQPFERYLKVETSPARVEAFRSKVPGADLAERLNLVEVRSSDDDSELAVVSLGPGLFWFELFGVALAVVQLPLTYVLVRLDYELRWYIVTDRSLRIREGITSLREATLTFANIQNLSIAQGPIQRLLGISDLRVRTAGGGSKGDHGSSDDDGSEESMHIAYFRGVDNAPELRDAILAQLERGDAGLGDPRPAAAGVAAAAGIDSVVEAARQVLDETRALGAALRGRVRNRGLGETRP